MTEFHLHFSSILIRLLSCSFFLQNLITRQPEFAFSYGLIMFTLTQFGISPHQSALFRYRCTGKQSHVSYVSHYFRVASKHVHYSTIVILLQCCQDSNWSIAKEIVGEMRAKWELWSRLGLKSILNQFWIRPISVDGIMPNGGPYLSSLIPYEEQLQRWVL